MRKPSRNDANGKLNRGHQMSFITPENLKLASFLLHHKGDVLQIGKLRVQEETVCKLASQKNLKVD